MLHFGGPEPRLIGFPPHTREVAGRARAHGTIDDLAPGGPTASSRQVQLQRCAFYPFSSNPA
ncbi:hypothetical protein V8D89_000585 [Ganoderma adspersum]